MEELVKLVQALAARKKAHEEHEIQPVQITGSGMSDPPPPPKPIPGDAPLIYAEEMPEFPGGPDTLKAYIRKNLKYPEGNTGKYSFVLSSGRTGH